METGTMFIHHLHKFPQPNRASSSSSEFSGGSPSSFTAAATPSFHYACSEAPPNSTPPFCINPNFQETNPSLLAPTKESSISFYQRTVNLTSQERDAMEAMREMIFRMAVMQPIQIDPESVKPPKRKNVRISSDPQSVAARHRRERISHRIRILQRMVPGGTKLDTASMLDEAVHYLKFLKKQVQSLEEAGGGKGPIMGTAGSFPVVGPM